MSGGSGGRRSATKAPAPPEKPAAEKSRSGRAAAAPAPSPPAKAKRVVAAPVSDARREAQEEAVDMARAVADDGEGSTDKPASPPPAAKKSERAMTLELQKEKAERAKLLAETERLRKELDAFTARESKRRQSEAAEQAPPAKRAAGSGRRSASAPQVQCLPGLLCIVFHSSGSFETRLCNGGVGDPPHHNGNVNICFISRNSYHVHFLAECSDFSKEALGMYFDLSY